MDPKPEAIQKLIDNAEVEMNLSSKKIGDEWAKEIVNALEKKNTLTKINLYENKIVYKKYFKKRSSP